MPESADTEEQLGGQTGLSRHGLTYPEPMPEPTGSLLAVQLTAGLGVPGAGLLQGLLVVGAPVLIDVVASS